jgi:hypothetical protein
MHSMTTRARQEYTHLRQEYIKVTSDDRRTEVTVAEDTDRLTKYLEVTNLYELQI